MNKQFPCPVITVFSRRVKPGFESEYEAWTRGINQTVATFPGSQGITVIRPGRDSGEYVTIVQFDQTENLDRWLASTERASWLTKLEAITLDSEEISSMTGMERWFTLPDRPVSQAPPRYKSAILVILGIYPLSLIVNPIVKSLTGGWPHELQVLASISISVPLMVWVMMPLLTRLFFNWLYPEPKSRIHEVNERVQARKNKRREWDSNPR